MSILPASKREWLNFLLFPFKAYVVIVLVWAFVWKWEPFNVRAAQMKDTQYILTGFAGCVVVFVSAAVIQFVTHDRRSALASTIFAVATFIALVFLLPVFALSK
ncbi:MAG: hypothetical protein ACLQU3_04980 [Limisphaerales bacterium]